MIKITINYRLKFRGFSFERSMQATAPNQDLVNFVVRDIVSTLNAELISFDIQLTA